MIISKEASVLSIIAVLFLGGCSEYQAKKVVAEKLVDPDSAEFRNVRIFEDDAGSNIVCGEVNGKNRMGAYAGHVRFIVVYDDVAYLEHPDALDADVAKQRFLQCRAENYDAPKSCPYEFSDWQAANRQSEFNETWEKRCTSK